MSLIEKLLRKYVPFKEIGWTNIGEKFTRYSLIKTRWGNLYLHQLNAPDWHPTCHSHPWSFITLLIKGGYLEQVGAKNFHRRVGTILYRPAEFAHNVITPYGTSWSLVVTSPKKREWGFTDCRVD
jgi:hypothetical protein